MNQSERMNNPFNDWEPRPWDASDAIADEQLAGFRERAARPIAWSDIRDLASPEIFGMSQQWLRSLDVEYYAEYGGEQLLLMQMIWHGFPDPPEWRLASRALGNETAPWHEWGYFAHLPELWSMPNDRHQ